MVARALYLEIHGEVIRYVVRMAGHKALHIHGVATESPPL